MQVKVRGVKHMKDETGRRTEMEFCLLAVAMPVPPRESPSGKTFTGASLTPLRVCVSE